MKPQQKTETMGMGCAVQGIGVGLIGLGLAWWPMILVGLSALVIGSLLARKWVCPQCGNRLDSGSVKLCPSCRADLSG